MSKRNETAAASLQEIRRILGERRGELLARAAAAYHEEIPERFHAMLCRAAGLKDAAPVMIDALSDKEREALLDAARRVRRLAAHAETQLTRCRYYEDFEQ